MGNFNRLANAHNRFQGNAKRILTVCSAGLLRSPTIAWVLSNEPYNFNTRAAGIATEYALIPVDEVLLEWADEIVCAQEEHAEVVRELLNKQRRYANISEGFPAKPIYVLNIEDNYAFRDPKLIAQIQAAVKNIY